jgi:hypothetical protein
VPCSFKERLNKFTTNWLVVESYRLRKFDLFLHKEKERTIICGPYWKSFVRVFDIGIGDVVQFQLDDDPYEPVENLFNVTVYRDGVEKDNVVDSGMCFTLILLHVILILSVQVSLVLLLHDIFLIV